MKKVLLFKLLVLCALVVAGCSDKHNGDSSDYGLLGDDNSTTALNGQGGNKDSNTTKDDNSSSNDNNGSSGCNSDTNTTSGNGGKDSNTTNGGSSGGVDSNTTTGGSDTNSTGANSDTNSTNGNGDNNGTGGNGDTNSTNGNSGGGNSGDTNTTNGNDSNTTTDDNTTLSEIKSINLKVTKTKLNKDTNTSLKVTAKTKDNKQIDITQKVKWIINPKGAVIIDKNTLIAKKDINTTIQAKYKNLSSNKIKLNIYWEVNRHILPPEPDPQINNATLGGVDSNNNGVRDDVERWIYKNFVKQIYEAILIDEAKFYQMTMIKPIEKAQETEKYSTRIGNCSLYLKHNKQRPKNWRNIKLQIKYMTINTKERVRKYLDYNIALSGGVYGSSPKDWNRKACSKEVIKVLEEMGK